MTEAPMYQLADIVQLLKDSEVLRRQILQLTPAGGSTAEYDLITVERSIGSREPVERVLHLADMWTLIAADHLCGTGVLLQDGSTVIPIFPLLRAVLEHSAWVCWLLDHKQDSMGRATRAALAHLRSDVEMVGVTTNWRSDNETRRLAKERAKETRLSIVRDFGDLDPSKPSIHGATVPRPTEVIAHFGACEGNAGLWEGTYTYLCGTANHPSRNSFEFFEWEVDGRFRMFLTNDFTIRLIRMALTAFVHSLRHTVSYVGGDRASIDNYLSRLDVVLVH